MTSKNQPDNAVALPVEWPEHYSEANRTEAAAIAAQLAEIGKTRSWLSRLSQIGRAHV